MAVVGSATLNIVPKIQGGLANYINGAIDRANVSGAGRQAGSGFMGGFASGANFGVWSTVASKAIGIVSDSLGSAAGRVDTLNNYPRIMESLGVETEAANRSIGTMSDALSNVPTRLDDMATVVQGMYAATMKYGTSLDTVTDAGLALNSMLLAGGQSQVVVNSAMEQFRQMVAKGKPELQDWKSLVQAAPGQLEQLAKKMLDASATADDLYAALGGGKESDYEGPYAWGSIDMGEFVARFSEMRGEFEGAAEQAQGGIQTAFSNMQNAVTRGVAGVMEAFGQERIAGAIGDVKGMINDAFGVVQGVAGFLAPALSGLWDALSPFVPAVAGVAAAIGGLSAVGGVVMGVAAGAADAVLDFATATGFAAKSEALLGFALDPVVIGIGAAVVGAVALAAAVQDMTKETRGTVELKDAIRGISDAATDAASALDSGDARLADAFSRSRDAAQKARDAHQGYVDALSDTAAAIREADERHDTLAAGLERAMATIDGYAGRTDLSATQQWELKNAVDAVNEACGTQYAVVEGTSDIINGETGEVQDSTTAIWENVRAREAISKADALSEAKSSVADLLDKAALDRAASADAFRTAEEGLDILIERYGSLDAVRSKARETDQYAPDHRLTEDAAEAAFALKLWEDASGALREANENERQLTQTSAELAAEQEALYRVGQAGADAASLSVSDLVLSSGVAMQALNDGGTKSQHSILELADAIESCATDGGRLREALADPQSMAQIVNAYDGTADSLRDTFASLGIGWDAAASKVASSQREMALMEQWLGRLDTTATASMQSMAGSVGGFAERLAESGVAVESLSKVGLEDFSSMLAMCGGDLGALTSMLALYNQQGIEDKDGRISVDQVPLVDAQGNVYAWNGTELLDKDGNVVVDGTELMDAWGNVVEYNACALLDKDGNVVVDAIQLHDAQGALYEWDGTSLKDQHGNVVTEDIQLRDTQDRMYTFNATTLASQLAVVTSSGAGGLRALNDGLYEFQRQPSYTEKTVATINRTINQVTTAVNTVFGTNVAAPTVGSGKAAGGVRLHAAGAIATRAVPLDIVGEDGAEAIVPLTNRRYSQPFADILAERIGERLGRAGGTTVDVQLNYEAGEDANQMARDLARAIGRTRIAMGVM